MIGIMCLSLFAPVTCKQVSAMTILETDVAAASDGCTMFGVYGSYYSEAQDALDRINEIRKEACNAGDVPDPRDPSRMLTPGDYVPVKWSKDLESVARIRAMEGGLAYNFFGSGHNRLNGESIFELKYNGIQSYAEDLAYNWGTSMVYGINQWYEEKSDWVNQVSGTVTGHYTSMIDPRYNYVGLGDFYTEEAKYPNTLAGEFYASSKNLDQTMQAAQTDVMQKIEVKDSYITGYVLEGVDTIYTDKTTTLTPKVSLANGSKTHKLWLIDSLNYASSDSSVATVTNDGVVTGLKNGTTTITVKSGGTTLASTVITVKCNHEKELISETQPTCTTAGVKVYSCEICGEAMEQEIPKTPHDYVYGEADSAGYRKGVCSVCGDTVRIIPPTTFALYWNTSAYGTFSSVFPTSIPVNSSIYCYIYGVNGDSSYQDMIMESTDQSVISVPTTAIPNSANNKLNVIAPGITTLTVYPKYNPKLRKKVIARIGDSGSVDISTADVTLSQTSYEYDGTACTPSVSVSYHDTILTQGTDYKVAYADNTEAGTATVVITGYGLFSGTIRKNFTILKAEHTEHIYGDWKVIKQPSCTMEGKRRRDCTVCDYYETEEIGKLEHTIVEDAAVAATCTKEGKTAGSHCSVCGVVIKSQEEIPATGHDYLDGKCKNCNDIIYVNMNDLRYTILDEGEDSHVVSVVAQEGKTLIGEVNIPSGIEINGENYSVTIVEQDAFAGQDKITVITIPDTVIKIESGAFSKCSSLESIIFSGTTAPAAAEAIFTDVDASSIVIMIPENATGYDVFAEKTGVTLKKEHVHSMVYHKAIEATCEETGNKEYYFCAGCGNIYSDEFGENRLALKDIIINATGHSWEDTYTIDVPATSTTEGLKSIHCSQCSVTKDQVVIPATGTDDDKEDGGEEKPIEGEEGGTEGKPTEGEEGGSEDKPTEGEEGGSEDKPIEGEEGGTEGKPTEGEEGGTEGKPTEGEEGGTEGKPTEGEEGGTEGKPTEGEEGGTEGKPNEGKEDGDGEKTTEEQEDGDEEKSIVVKEDGNTGKLNNMTSGDNAVNNFSDKDSDEDDIDEDDLEDEDFWDEQEYPKVGVTFTVKGIIYKVVKSNPKEEELEVSCIGTKSKSIVKLNIPNYVSDENFDYEVVSIGKKAFSGCKKLKSVSMGDFVTSIGNQAFYGCTSLKKITLQSKTKKIGVQAFAKCKMLSLVNIKSSLLTEKNIGRQAFGDINKKAVVKVPSKKKAVYKKWLRKKGLIGKKQKVQ